MISVFKKGTPKIVGGLGDGTRTSPWYWYGKTSGQTVAVNNSNADSGDRYRVYLRVKLKGGVEYTIGQTSVGGDGDGMIWLYNSAMSEVANDDHSYGDIAGLEVQDVMWYTPPEDGVYIIGAGAYSSDTGAFTVAMSPAPEQETLPEIEYQYPTSSGFNAFGKPLKFRNAAEAGCGLIPPIPEDGLIRYAPLDKYYANTTPGESYFCPIGNVTFETVDGVPSAYFGKADGYRFMQAYFLESPDGFTCSLWCRNMETIGTAAFCVCNSGCSRWDFIMWMNNTSVSFSSGNSLVGADFEDNGKIRHFSVRYSSGILDLFLDGSLIASWGFTLNIVTDQYYTQIAKKENTSETVNGLEGYISSFRIYNRALSDKEIKALAREFKI